MTVSGHWIDFLDPDPREITIEDIAYGLSGECRFANHLNEFYSVAQHSILVSRLCENPLAGLLHDASESFTRDIPSPLKKLCPKLQIIEKRLQEVIFNKFVAGHLGDDLHICDQIAIEAENEYLRGDPLKYIGDLVPEYLLRPLTKEVVYEKFIDEFHSLVPDWGIKEGVRVG